MILELIELLNLINTCTPDVHPQTMIAIVETESSRDTLAIGINGTYDSNFKAETFEEAKEIVVKLQESELNFDVGLAQVNSANFDYLGLNLENMFDPCTNLKAGARILIENYTKAEKDFANEQDALLAAISAYNTGNYKLGLENGYVEKVKKNSYLVPKIEEAKKEISPYQVFEQDFKQNVFSNEKTKNTLVW